MLVLDDKVIETPIEDLVNLLKIELNSRGIDKLKVIIKRSNNLEITCPVHKNGQENRPSCGVLLEDKGEIPAGTCSCFACGYHASFLKFIADCLEVSYNEAKDWLFSVANYSLYKREREIGFITLEEPVNNVVKLKEYKDDLSKYNYIHPYMFKRKLTEEVIEKFQVGYDPVTNAITFPVFQEGKLVSVVKRSVVGKRFYMPDVSPKPIYGLDYLTSNEVIVCESIINALTCWSWGYQAIALLGTGSEEQLNQLSKLPQRKFILALDGDSAGRKGTYKIKKFLKDRWVTVLDIPKGKDVNDLTKEEFEEIYSKS